MSPRSLLFSSDQETLRLLAEALEELEFEVEACSEIFAAIEKVTTQSFELIVAVWADGLKASFLLKTARELKVSCDAVTVAVTGDSEASAIARQLGAAIILKHPVVVEEAKYTLLSSDVFLRGMRTWVSMLTTQVGDSLGPATIPQGPQLVSPPPSVLSQEAEIPPEPSARFWPHLVKSPRSKNTRNAPKGRRWTRVISLACALGIALSSAGYVFSAPLHSQEITTSVQQIYESAVTKTHKLLGTSERDSNAPVQLAQNSGSPSRRDVTR